MIFNPYSSLYIFIQFIIVFNFCLTRKLKFILQANPFVIKCSPHEYLYGNNWFKLRASHISCREPKNVFNEPIPHIYAWDNTFKCESNEVVTTSSLLSDIDPPDALKIKMKPIKELSKELNGDISVDNQNRSFKPVWDTNYHNLNIDHGVLHNLHSLTRTVYITFRKHPIVCRNILSVSPANNKTFCSDENSNKKASALCYHDPFADAPIKFVDWTLLVEYMNKYVLSSLDWTHKGGFYLDIRSLTTNIKSTKIHITPQLTSPIALKLTSLEALSTNATSSNRDIFTSTTTEITTLKEALTSAELGTTTSTTFTEISSTNILKSTKADIPFNSTHTINLLTTIETVLTSIEAADRVLISETTFGTLASSSKIILTSKTFNFSSLLVSNTKQDSIKTTNKISQASKANNVTSYTKPKPSKTNGTIVVKSPHSLQRGKKNRNEKSSTIKKSSYSIILILLLIFGMLCIIGVITFFIIRFKRNKQDDDVQSSNNDLSEESEKETSINPVKSEEIEVNRNRRIFSQYDPDLL